MVKCSSESAAVGGLCLIRPRAKVTGSLGAVSDVHFEPHGGAICSEVFSILRHQSEQSN